MILIKLTPVNAYKELEPTYLSTAHIESVSTYEKITEIIMLSGKVHYSNEPVQAFIERLATITRPVTYFSADGAKIYGAAIGESKGKRVAFQFFDPPRQFDGEGKEIK